MSTPTPATTRPTSTIQTSTIQTSTIPTSSRRRRTATRVLAAVAALTVVPAMLVATPAAASAPAVPTTVHADAAAGWLGRQLSADHVAVGAFGPDYGLTADIVLALDSAGTGRNAATKATAALKQHVIDYTGFGDPNEFFAGSFAKLLNVAAAQHANPRAFGGSARHDLVGLLRYLECGNGRRPACGASDDGRFADISSFGDFSNTIGQSLALTGLERTTKAGPSTRSVVYLRDQQCANGAFPLELSTPGCTPSVDATSFAVQALLAVGGKKATESAQLGSRWLKRHQNSNGSFTGNGAPNTNTTGLAAQALLAAGRGKASAEAVRFIGSLQIGCGGKAKNRGEVRYAKHAAGDPVRATAQAVPALAGVGLADISNSGAAKPLATLSC
jgi:hypothetical protein